MLGVMTQERAERTLERVGQRFHAQRFGEHQDLASAERWDTLYDAFEARWESIAPEERCEHTLCPRTGLPTTCCECYEYDGWGLPLPVDFIERMERRYHLRWDEAEQVWYRKVL